MFFVVMGDTYARSNIYLLADREIRTKIIGTYLGLWHYLLTPLMLLLVYTFVFGVIFKVRWPGGGESTTQFALRIFLGLIVLQVLIEVMSRAPNLVLENPSYVKKIVFPLETLVPTAILVALFAAGISGVVFIVAYFVVNGLPPIASLWTIVIWPPVVLFSAGAGWALAALGVFLRDLKHFVAIFCSILLFLSPVFYPISSVPPGFRQLLWFNPMSFLIESIRDAIFEGIGPSPVGLVIVWVSSIAVAQVGYWGFMRSKKAFADVL